MRYKYQILVVNKNSESMTSLLRHPEYHISCYSEPIECIQQIQNSKYDLVIIDSELSQPDRLSFLADIKKIIPSMPVLVVSGPSSVTAAVECIKGGACDFIEKPLKKKNLLTSVENILRCSFFKTAQNEVIVKRLTKSEMRILKHILDGKSNKGIAHLLNRSERTIEDHRSNIMKKLEADNIVELVKKGISLGLTGI